MFVLLVSIALLAQASSARPSSYAITLLEFESFTPTSCNNDEFVDLFCSGSVTSSDGFLSLTSQGKNQVGRFMYKKPIDISLKRIATSFTFKIIPSAHSNDSGDGMSFIIASNTKPSPRKSYGSYLGIMDPTRDGSASGQLAVAFDAYKNDHNNDTDGNHVAIVTKSLANPLASKSFNHSGIHLKSGKEIKIEIFIDDKEITVSAEEQKRHAKPTGFANIVKTKIDISKVLPNLAYVGFTASTGASTQSHQLLKWTFSNL